MLIETSYNYGTFEMTQNIYDTLKRYDLQADARITYRYQQHYKKENKNIKNKEKGKKMPKIRNIQLDSSILNENDQRQRQQDIQFLNPNVQYYKKFQKHYKLRKRTFKS